jgi:hypothetical protein
MLWLALVWTATAHDHAHDSGGEDANVVAAEIGEIAPRCGLAEVTLPTISVGVVVDDGLSLPANASPHDLAMALAAHWHPGDDALSAARQAVLTHCLEREAHGYQVGVDTVSELTDPKGSALAGQRLGMALTATLDTGPAMAALASWDALAADAPAPVAELLDADADAWRAALSDPDRDGLTTLHERLLGTDPARWDSDGDGWWDGAVVPEAPARPLFLDETFACFDVSPRRKRTAEIAVWRRDAHGGVARVQNFDSKHGIVLSPSLPGPPESLALWATLRGDELRPNGDCVTRPGATLRIEKDAFGALGLDDSDATSAREEARALLTPIAEALDAAADDWHAAFGAPPARPYVQLVESQSRVSRSLGTWPRVDLEARFAKTWDKGTRLADLAGLSWALHYVGLADDARISRLEPAVALWTAQAPHKVAPNLFGADAKQVKAWTAAAASCKSGWSGLLDRSCRAPR